MKTLDVALPGRSYCIFISPMDLAHSVITLQKKITEERFFIITNRTIEKLYRKKIEKAFGNKLKIFWYSLPDGESTKTLASCEKILIWLSKLGAQRSSALLALGGGVVGDITGFVAATYMRGIDYYQMPTTLLAQVDSSVGGKTGVDLPTGKNLVGAFYQPRAVFIHTDFLKTLPLRELYCGFAEVLKYGVIADAKFWQFLKTSTKAIQELQPQAIAKVIECCCAIKARVVLSDEKEAGLRAILNFGHTMGHAVELLGKYKKDKHGEAVARGMVYAARLSCALGYCTEVAVSEIAGLLQLYHLPVAMPDFSRAQYARALVSDKKSAGKNIKFILVSKIGKVQVVPLSIQEITQWL